MKKLIFTLAIVFGMASMAHAGWTLSWTGSTGASGYQVEWKTLAGTTFTPVDVGTATTWAIPATWVKGTRYEMKVKAYVGTTTKSYSGDSDLLRWTYPQDPVVVELPAAPSQMILNFTP